LSKQDELRIFCSTLNNLKPTPQSDLITYVLDVDVEEVHQEEDDCKASVSGERGLLALSFSSNLFLLIDLENQEEEEEEEEEDEDS